MADALVPFDTTQLPATQLGSDAAFTDLAKGGDFLSRIQLYTKGKAIDTGAIRPGRWGIPESGGAIADLGDTINVLPLARRPKAIDMSDESAVIAVYDEASDEFKRIAAASAEQGSHCQFGVSFLVFEDSTGGFYEVFFGNKSSRPEAKKLYPYLPLTQADIDRRAAAGADVGNLTPHGPQPVTLKIRLASNKKGSWHVPLVLKSSSPFSAKLPDMKAVAAQITRFVTVKDGGVERVQEPAGKPSRAR